MRYSKGVSWIDDCRIPHSEEIMVAIDYKETKQSENGWNTKNRILELTIKANAYDVINHVSKFNLPQAFDWNSTREGGDYWLKVFIELNNFLLIKKLLKSHKTSIIIFQI
jgi:hypothetical protein